jgi:hypothetical protein
MNRYATKARLGHEPTDEDLARIHNGGPNGVKRRSTIGYWHKVQQFLRIHQVAIARIRSYLGVH